MMLAWLSSSEKTTLPCGASAGDRAGVGEVAGAEEQRRLVALERRQPLARARRCGRHVAGDQPRGAGAGAPAHRRLGGGRAHAGMVGEAEVVVRAEQQDRLAVEQSPAAPAARRSAAAGGGAPGRGAPPAARRRRSCRRLASGYGGGFLVFLITRSWVEGSQKSASSWRSISSSIGVAGVSPVEPARAVVGARVGAVVVLAGDVEAELLEHRPVVLGLGARGW